jgi:hypothetical protein
VAEMSGFVCANPFMRLFNVAEGFDALYTMYQEVQESFELAFKSRLSL